MAHSFVAYIDEAGDDGLPGHYRQPGRQGGASHWLTIGAVVWRMSRDLDFVGHARNIIKQLPPQKQKKPLHFKELDHPQRIMAINGILDKPMRLTAVIANKPVIPEGIYVQKNQLYHYVCRYLVERISWLCRDLRKSVPEGDGRVKIIFARRGGMSYPQFQNYLHFLHNQDETEIHWPVIDIDGVEAYDQSERYGLQLADIAVSGLNAALEPDFYGNAEDRFARSLKPMIYNRGTNYFSYGAKMFPPLEQLENTPILENFADIFK